MVKLLLIAFFAFTGATAHAQYHQQNWWALSYDFEQIKINESNSVKVGHLPLADIELGVALSPMTAVAIHGRYGENNINFDGTTQTGVRTNQSISARQFDLRAEAIYTFISFAFNIGYASRDFYDSGSGQFSHDTKFEYLPIGLYYWSPPYYLHAELRKGLSGTERVMCSDLGGGRQDITLKEDSNDGYALELGWVIDRPAGIKIFFEWSKWNLGGSNTQFNGVESVNEPSRTINQELIGFGYIF